jgi:glycosyltransferase involved in cell wall biosynthesis
MQYPIRVLHVVVNMNRGGAETLIMNLYRNIDRERVQFDFLVHKSQGAFEEEITALGGRIHRIPYITEIGHFKYIKELNKFFRKHSEYKIVHAHMDSMSGLVLEAANSAGIPVRISHSHNTQNEGSILGRIYKEVIKTKVATNATNLLACSQSAADWLFGKSADRALTIKNGVEGRRFAYSCETRNRKRNELNIEKDSLLVGHVGRFYAQKNHTFVIDIFSKLKENIPNSLLLLVGEGPLKSDIEKKVKELNIKDSVFFLGVRNDVEELMQAMDVLVFPSHHEGLPLTIVEAQAAGLKCVVSEAVPESADIGADLITFIDLKAELSKWVREIRKPYERDRKVDTFLKNSGYDITYTAKEIQNKYLGAFDKLA